MNLILIYQLLLIWSVHLQICYLIIVARHNCHITQMTGVIHQLIEMRITFYIASWNTNSWKIILWYEKIFCWASIIICGLSRKHIVKLDTILMFQDSNGFVKQYWNRPSRGIRLHIVLELYSSYTNIRKWIWDL